MTRYTKPKPVYLGNLPQQIQPYCLDGTTSGKIASQFHVEQFESPSQYQLAGVLHTGTEEINKKYRIQELTAPNTATQKAEKVIQIKSTQQHKRQKEVIQI